MKENKSNAIISKNDMRNKLTKWFRKNVSEDFDYTFVPHGNDYAIVYEYDDTEEQKFYGIFDFENNKFIDDSLSIKDYLDIFEVEDNPFDDIVYFAIGILREAIYASKRYKGKKSGRNSRNIDSIYNSVSRMEEIYNMLDCMGEDTLKFLRDTSYFGKDDKAFTSIKSLINCQKSMDTVYYHLVPCRDLEYEKVRLGEDSEEYKKLLNIRALVDNIDITEDNIDLYEGIICEPEECDESDEEYDEIKHIVDTYNLTLDDIEYAKSYIWKRMTNKNG